MNPWSNTVAAIAGKTAEEKSNEIIVNAGLDSATAYAEAVANVTGTSSGASLDSFVESFKALSQASPEAARDLTAEIEQQVACLTQQTPVYVPPGGSYVPGQGIRNYISLARSGMSWTFQGMQAVAENVADTLAIPKNVPDIIKGRAADVTTGHF